jgi:hypothetical protein
MTQERSGAFQSSHDFDNSHVPTMAVYCSDGRFGEQCDDFLHNGLKLPRYDRIVVPGGAGCLAGHFSSFREEEGLLEQLRFLIKAHNTEHVVLIAHEDCGFYAGRLRIPPAQAEAQQREDLQAAVRRICSISSGLKVDTFFARIGPDGAIRFELMA